MEITDTTIDKLAELTKLTFDVDKKASIKKDLSKIINFMEQLNELDTNDIEPLIYINEDTNVVRQDIICDTINKDNILEQAPLADNNYFKVPKFIKHKA